MADSKSKYSSEAKFYTRVTSHSSIVDAIRFARSKHRESKFNENWKKHMVNINDVISQFTPGVKGKPKGVKFQFENENYIVKVDMPSGYLRIYDKKAKSYIRIDGTPSRREEDTHFKIMKRKEMPYK